MNYQQKNSCSKVININNLREIIINNHHELHHSFDMVYEISEEDWSKYIKKENYKLIYYFCEIISIIIKNEGLNDKKESQYMIVMKLVKFFVSIEPRKIAIIIFKKTNLLRKLIFLLNFKKYEILCISINLLYDFIKFLPKRSINQDDTLDIIINLDSLLSADYKEVYKISVMSMIFLYASSMEKQNIINYIFCDDNRYILSEFLIRLVNTKGVTIYQHDKEEFLYTIKFLRHAFFMNKFEYFYTSDLLILIEILTRYINDMDYGSQEFNECTHLLYAVMKWPKYKEIREEHCVEYVIISLYDLLLTSVIKGDEYMVDLTEKIILEIVRD